MWFRTCLLLATAVTTLSVSGQEPYPVDETTGLIVDDNWQLVLGNCSSCHSLKLVTQNRMDAQTWTETIRWMQEKHNLWDLGESEGAIVAYLDKHYGIPQRPHRRQPLNQPPLEPESTP